MTQQYSARALPAPHLPAPPLPVSPSLPVTGDPFTNKRLFELDWLRVLVFGLLIFYHTGMLYAEGWGWHYKSTYTSQMLTNIMLWSNQWRMSLLFFISGAAMSFLIAKQPWGTFIRTRIPLLLLPLLFGMLVVVVPQVYVEANSSRGIRARINAPQGCLAIKKDMAAPLIKNNNDIRHWFDHSMTLVSI